MAESIKTNQEYYYDAFISYRHTEPDMRAAVKLHRALEGFRIPVSIAKQTGIKKIKRVFRDQEELPTSDNLSDDIRKALEQSRYLIVVCSPRTPESKWCCQEIDDFREIHGNNRILSILIEGEPSKAFPESLRFIDERIENPDGTETTRRHEVEPLAADIRGKSLREMWKKLRVEKLRLLAPMLGVRFDDLRHRQRERFIKRAAAIAIVVSAFFAAFGIVASIQSNTISTLNQQLFKKNDELQAQVAKTEEQRAEADKNRIEAEKQAGIAQENQKKAEDNAATAKLNEKEAIKQKTIAEDNAKEAERQKTLAEGNALEAQKQKSIAEVNAKTAENERDNALLNESKTLSEMSKQETDNGNRLAGIKLALEALPGRGASSIRPFVPEAVSSLYYSLYNKPFQGRFIVKDHSGLINDASYSADGMLLATVSNDCTIKVWDVASGNVKLDIGNQNSQVLKVAISPDKKYLATVAAWDYNAKVWDIGTGKLVKDLEPFSGYFPVGGNGVQFSSDGKRLAVTNSQYGVMIIDTVTWKKLSVINTEKGFYMDFSSSIDFNGGKVLIYSPSFSDFNLYDMADASKISSGTVEGKVVFSSFSPDGKHIAVCSDNGTVYIINSKTLEQTATLSGHTSRVNGVAFNKKGLLLTYSEDKTARLWDYSSGELLYELNPEYGPVLSGDFSPDGSMAVTAYEDGKAVVWDCATGKEAAVLDKHRNSIFKALFSPDGKTITTVAYDNTARVWDIQGGKEYINLNGHTAAINSVAFSPDGKKLATASADSTLRIWDPASGRELLKISQPGYIFINARFSRDGTKLMSPLLKDYEGGIGVFNSSNGNVENSLDMTFPKLYTNNFESMRVRKYIFTFWDLTSALWERVDQKDFDKVSSHFFEWPISMNSFSQDYVVSYGSFSNDGKKFVSTSMSNYRGFEIRIWDLAKGDMTVKLKTNNLTGYNADYVFFSPDAKKVITISFGLGINIWDANTGEKIMKLPDQNSLYSFAAFSSDGRMIAASCMDGTVCLWDAQNGRLITRLPGHKDMVPWLDFSPDGNKLATISTDGTATVWRIFPDTQELIDYAEKLLQAY